METDQTRQEHADDANRHTQHMRTVTGIDEAERVIEGETAKRERESLSPTAKQDPKKKKR